MSMLGNIATGPGPDYQIFPDYAYLTAGATFAAGDVVGVTVVSPGTGPTTTITTPSTAHLKYGICAVAVNAVTSGDVGLFMFRGFIQAFTQSAGGAATIGVMSTYTLRTTKTLDVDPPLVLPRKIFALALETSSGAASATRALRWVQFNGVEGFGLDFGSNGASNAFTPAQTLAAPLTVASAAYASSATISTFATTTAGTDDISAAVPASTLNTAGRSLLITASGTWGATATPTLTLAPYLDTIALTAGTQVALHSMVGTLTALTGQLWCMQWLVSCKTTGATGTVYTSAVGGKIASATSSDVGVPVTSAAVDLTAALFVKIRPTWSASSASNTTTLDSLMVQRVN